MDEKHICCICSREFYGHGNNPEPVEDFRKGVCCDDCNIDAVIPARAEALHVHAKLT